MMQRPPSRDGTPGVGDLAPRPETLAEATLLVPIRSSSGAAVDPATVDVDAFRHGTDDSGTRFIAAFSGPESLAEFGPPGSDHVAIRGRDLFTRADEAHRRVVVDPGAPTQLEIPEGLLAFLAAGIDPNRPDALRARRPSGELGTLQPPGDVPEPFGAALSAALTELAQVERAWLLRTGEAWTIGVQLHRQALLGHFDAVRNRLHAVASEHLGSRRQLAVTDLRAPSLREMYDGTAAPFFVRQAKPRGLLGRLFGS